MAQGMKRTIKKEIRILSIWIISTIVFIYSLSLYLDLFAGKSFSQSTVEFINILYGEDAYYLFYLILLIPYIYYKFLSASFNNIKFLRLKYIRIFVLIIFTYMLFPFIYVSFDNNITNSLVRNPLEFKVDNSLISPTIDNYKNYEYLRTWTHWCGTGGGITYEIIKFKNDTTVVFSSTFISFENWFAVKHLLNMTDGVTMPREIIYKNDLLKNFYIKDYKNKIYGDKHLQFIKGKFIIEQGDEAVIDAI